MNRAFAMDRVPSGRIGGTGELAGQTDSHDRLVNRLTNQTTDGLPSGAAGSSTNHPYLKDPPGIDGYAKLRSAEPLPIAAKAVLPCKTASGRWYQGPARQAFLARTNYRDLIPGTLLDEIR